nr:MAG TPA: hypothetical protein [Caudoviricetes sp.]
MKRKVKHRRQVLHFYNPSQIILFCQVVPSAYSPSIVAYNLMWKLSLL